MAVPEIPLVPEGTLDPAAGLNLSLNTVAALLQTSVINMDLLAPPGSPVNDDMHIVAGTGGTATGAWAGHEKALARYVANGTSWTFYEAGTAVNQVLNQEDGGLYSYVSGAWIPAAAGIADATQGKQAIYIPARNMSPSATGGSAALATIASAANQPDIQTLNFDTTTQEFAQFAIVLPKKWNLGVLTYKAHWSHAATTVNFGVVWGLQAVAVSNDDAIAVAFGTGVNVSDTGGTTNDLYTSAESGNLTVGGTPAAEDMVFFRVFRVPADGSDTMAIDARLHGITLYYVSDANNDA